jgi:hypothetical protein
VIGLFLDIEETLVESLEKPDFILWSNLHGIQRLAQELKPDFYKTFSFGLWSQGDVSIWEGIRHDMKTEFGWDIQTQDELFFDLKRAFLKDILGQVTDDEVKIDFMKLTNKERVFEWWVLKNFKSGLFVLVDDRVANKTVTFPDHDLTIRFVEVTSLRKRG